MRRGRDSNPRGRLSPASLAVRYFRPLSHLSELICFLLNCLCGGGEIRTHGELPHDGFQDRCLQPLGHTSVYNFKNCCGLEFLGFPFETRLMLTCSHQAHSATLPFSPKSGFIHNTSSKYICKYGRINIKKSKN